MRRRKRQTETNYHEHNFRVAMTENYWFMLWKKEGNKGNYLWLSCGTSNEKNSELSQFS